jgi:hypothetical protein
MEHRQAPQVIKQNLPPDIKSTLRLELLEIKLAVGVVTRERCSLSEEDIKAPQGPDAKNISAPDVVGWIV